MLLEDGQCLRVEGIADSGRVETVYNIEVEDDHTYFVGEHLWGWAVWSHNKSCGEMHHIATDKSIKSGWTAQFKALFAKAGLTLQNKANKVFLNGHKGRHSPLYHQHVLDSLTAATKGLSGRAYKAHLLWELRAIKNDLRLNLGMLKGLGLP